LSGPWYSAPCALSAVVVCAVEFVDKERRTFNRTVAIPGEGSTCAEGLKFEKQCRK